MAGNTSPAAPAPADEKAPGAATWDIPDFVRMPGGDDSGESSCASSPRGSDGGAAKEEVNATKEGVDAAKDGVDMEVETASDGISGVKLEGAKEAKRGVRFQDEGGGGRLDAMEAAAQRRAGGKWKPSAKQVDFGADGEVNSDDEDASGLTGAVGKDEEGMYDADMDDLDQQSVPVPTTATLALPCATP